ncbi:DUF551 domain-containing protein [Atlantibacter hermannii]|uniref:DUF551 domain-containing protein n=1 Tax=Atlantibacter hermannii TaxID=565 RepID=UPI0011CE66A7|nr:DUF551 domain-containing protein [Atlantibacter hermannii]
MTLTKVRLEWLTKISSRDEIDDIDGDEIRELARVALAALESRADAEPVTYDQVQRDHMKDILIHKMSSNLTSSVPLVMADIHAATMALMQAGFRVRPQPAPVVVDFNKLARELVENLVDCNGADDSAVKQYQKWAEKTCRAAMLQGIDEPISQPYTLPEWIPCSERMPEADGNYWGWWNESKRQGPVWFIKSDLQAQFQSSEITHWMPLPAALKQEAQEVKK